MGEPQLMTLEEVARFFRKSTRTILRYEASGLIPGRLAMPGKNAIWLKQDLVGFVLKTREKNERSPRLGAPRKSEAHQKMRLGCTAKVTSDV